MSYEIRKTGDDEIIGCNSCGSKVEVDEFDWGPSYNEKHETKNRYLCEFCAISFVGNVTRYPPKSPDDYFRKEIAVWISQATNYLEQKLRKETT